MPLPPPPPNHDPPRSGRVSTGGDRGISPVRHGCRSSPAPAATYPVTCLCPFTDRGELPANRSPPPSVRISRISLNRPYPGHLRRPARPWPRRCQRCGSYRRRACTRATGPERVWTRVLRSRGARDRHLHSTVARSDECSRFPGVDSDGYHFAPCDRRVARRGGSSILAVQEQRDALAAERLASEQRPAQPGGRGPVPITRANEIFAKAPGPRRIVDMSFGLVTNLGKTGFFFAVYGSCSAGLIYRCGAGGPPRLPSCEGAP